MSSAASGLLMTGTGMWALIVMGGALLLFAVLLAIVPARWRFEAVVAVASATSGFALHARPASTSSTGGAG